MTSDTLRPGSAALRSRIVGEGYEPPDQLLANPLNWRTHPAAQVEALEGLLQQVGWVQRVIVNKRTGHVVDGHARVALSLRRAEPAVPVLYVDLSEAEERLVLAALDPIAALATADADKLAELLADVQADDAGLGELLESLRPEDEDEGADGESTAGALAERFLIPPFSVLNAREGWWQERKRAWLALGIQSELGRGDCAPGGASMPMDRGWEMNGLTCGNSAAMRHATLNLYRERGRAEPGGNARPAMNYSKTKARGDGRGRPMK